MTAPEFDTVIAGGRVIDPQTGLDAVRSVGLRAGSIAAISDADLSGEQFLDARGLVVTPGFIDLHSHTQSLPGDGGTPLIRDGILDTAVRPGAAVRGRAS